MININEVKTLGKISEEWYEDRKKVLDRYWENEIDLETFKKELAEVDFKHKNPDEFRKKKIEYYKQKVENIKKNIKYDT